MEQRSFLGAASDQRYALAMAAALTGATRARATMEVPSLVLREHALREDGAAKARAKMEVPSMVPESHETRSMVLSDHALRARAARARATCSDGTPCWTSTCYGEDVLRGPIRPMRACPRRGPVRRLFSEETASSWLVSPRDPLKVLLDGGGSAAARSLASRTRIVFKIHEHFGIKSRLMRWRLFPSIAAGTKLPRGQDA